MNDLGVDAEAKDKEGFNSLHAATQAGQTQCVKVYRIRHKSKVSFILLCKSKIYFR